jgi:hypothetical protein
MTNKCRVDDIRFERITDGKGKTFCIKCTTTDNVLLDYNDIVEMRKCADKMLSNICPYIYLNNT